MSILDKVKGSISNLGNETIGEVDEVKLKPKKTQEIKEKPKKEPKPKKEKKESKINLNQLFKKTKKEENPVYIQEEKIVEEITSPEVVSFDSVSVTNTSTKLNLKNNPMLETLNISANVDWHGTNSLEEFENVEFSRVAPVGIDIPEVERFADKCISEIKTLRRIIEKRQNDFIKLLQEAENLQNKIIEKAYEEELTQSVLDRHEKEQELKEKIMALQLENNQLKHKIEKFELTTSFLTSTPELPSLKKNNLPSFDDDEEIVFHKKVAKSSLPEL